MDIAVFGGSFDPPHIGHAMVASWLVWTGTVDKVYLVPTYTHAFGKQSSPYNARVEWCRAFCYQVSEFITVHEIERRLPQPSFTLNMLRGLAETHLDDTLRLVVGSDILEEKHKWHRWEEIERDFHPIVVGREGYEPVPGAPTFPGFSSTEIRVRLALGKPVDHLVPKEVLEDLPKNKYIWAK